MLALQEANKALKEKNFELMEQAKGIFKMKAIFQESQEKAQHRINFLEKSLREKTEQYNTTSQKLTVTELALSKFAQADAAGPEEFHKLSMQVKVLQREMEEALAEVNHEKEEHVKTREEYKKMNNLLYDRADELVKRNQGISKELYTLKQDKTASIELAKVMKENENTKKELEEARTIIAKLEAEIKDLKESLQQAIMKAAAEPAEDKFDKSNRECQERAASAERQWKELADKTEAQFKTLTDRQIELEVEILNVRTENNFGQALNIDAQKHYLAFATLALDEKIGAFEYESSKTVEKIRGMEKTVGRYHDALEGLDSFWQHQQIVVLKKEVKELFSHLKDPKLSVENVAKAQGEALLNSMKAIEEEFRKKARFAEQAERDLKTLSNYYASQTDSATLKVKPLKNKDRKTGNRVIRSLNLNVSIPKQNNQEIINERIALAATREIGAAWTSVLANSIYEKFIEEWSKLDFLSPDGNKPYDDRMTYDQWQWQKNRNIARYYRPKSG